MDPSLWCISIVILIRKSDTFAPLMEAGHLEHTLPFGRARNLISRTAPCFGRSI